MIADVVRSEIGGKTDAIAVSGADAARLLGLSGRTWRRLDAAGLVPRAVKIGASKRWSVDGLKQWIKAGCPSRGRWEVMLKVGGA